MSKKKALNSLLLIVAFLLAVAIVAIAKGVAAPKRVLSESSKPSIMIFAAASLSEVIQEITDSFTVDHPVTIRINRASSGTLARQILQGVLPTLYISASEHWMHFVDSLGYIQKGSITEVARNSLVLVAPGQGGIHPVAIDSTVNIVSLLPSGRLSMGDPAHVPAGSYAQEALEYFGWYALLQSRIIPAKDVRSALMIVAMGEAPLGIVYSSDIVRSDAVTVVGTFPEYSHRPIVYMAGSCTNSKTGTAFLRYLTAATAQPLWQKHGFKSVLTREKQ